MCSVKTLACFGWLVSCITPGAQAVFSPAIKRHAARTAIAIVRSAWWGKPFARRGCRLQAVVNGMRDRGLAPLASPQDGMGQKKVLPTAFLQVWPPRVNHRFGSGSDVTTSKKVPFGVFAAILYFHGYIRLPLKVLLKRTKLREKNA